MATQPHSWSLPPDVPVIYVEREEQLEQLRSAAAAADKGSAAAVRSAADGLGHVLPVGLPLPRCRDVLAVAVCCAMDAEWPPEETRLEGRNGGPPHATLVQLALWVPPGCPLPGGGGGCGGDRAAGGCCVLLLDMLALPQAAAKQALQALFRCGWALGRRPAG